MCIIQRTAVHVVIGPAFFSCVRPFAIVVLQTGYYYYRLQYCRSMCKPVVPELDGKGVEEGWGRNFFTDHRMVMKIGSDPSDPSIPPRQRPSPPVNGIGRARRVCERRPRARDISNIYLTRYFFQLFFRLIPLDCQKETLLFISLACDIIHSEFKKVFLLFFSRKKSI